MRLERSDTELFYKLWFPLLDFVNSKYHVCPEAGPIDKELGVDAVNGKIKYTNFGHEKYTTLRH